MLYIIIKTKEKDLRKKQEIESLGYSLYYFNERDLENKEKLKNEIIKIMGYPMKKFIEKNPDEPQNEGVN